MEAYLKKLCFEYQVEEKEVKELLARMEMVYLDKGETIASATMPEQSLYIIVSGILHLFFPNFKILQSTGKVKLKTWIFSKKFLDTGAVCANCHGNGDDAERFAVELHSDFTFRRRTGQGNPVFHHIGKRKIQQLFCI